MILNRNIYWRFKEYFSKMATWFSIWFLYPMLYFKHVSMNLFILCFKQFIRNNNNVNHLYNFSFPVKLLPFSGLSKTVINFHLRGLEILWRVHFPRWWHPDLIVGKVLYQPFSVICNYGCLKHFPYFKSPNCNLYSSNVYVKRM